MSSDLHQRLLHGFAEAFGGKPDLVARAPGRVNLIGEHTDYNDGFALPMAIAAETQVAMRRHQEASWTVRALDFGNEQDTFALDRAPPFASEGGWRNYVRGVAATLLERGHRLDGAEIAIAGDIPKGAGLSSSASLEIGLIRALTAAFGEPYDPINAALDAQRAENNFVGVRCGALDQLSSAGGVEGCALLIDCRALTLTPAPMPSDLVVMIVQSGVERGLVDGRYNQRRAHCETAARLLGVEALRDVDMDGLKAAAFEIDAVVYKRARHIITENARTLAAVIALKNDDLTTIGRLMAESHASMKDDFEITVEHTDRLTTLIHAAIGGQGGARQTGGGFGGAVIGLMRVGAVSGVREAILRNYSTPSGELPDIRIERPQPGAGLLTL